MSLALPPRSAKPRTRGLTSMIDFGPDTFGWTGAPDGIRNLLEVCADYIDYAKIYALNSLLMPKATVMTARPMKSRVRNFTSVLDSHGVAHTSHRVDQLRVVGVDLATQVAHVGLDH